MDHKGAKISASAHSKLTPQRGFHSYTSSRRDPVNLARLYNTASPIIVCLLFLSCEITVKYLCKCFHATFRKTMKWPQMGWVRKLSPVIFIHTFIKPQQWSARLWGFHAFWTWTLTLEDVVLTDEWRSCLDLQHVSLEKDCYNLMRGNGCKFVFWWLRRCFGRYK